MTKKLRQFKDYFFYSNYSTWGDSFYSSIEILFKQEFINEVNKGNIFVNEYKDDPIGMIAHQKLHNSKIISYQIEGWFDITKFYRGF